MVCGLGLLDGVSFSASPGTSLESQTNLPDLAIGGAAFEIAPKRQKIRREHQDLLARRVGHGLSQRLGGEPGQEKVWITNVMDGCSRKALRTEA